MIQNEAAQDTAKIVRCSLLAVPYKNAIHSKLVGLGTPINRGMR